MVNEVLLKKQKARRPFLYPPPTLHALTLRSPPNHLTSLFTSTTMSTEVDIPSL